MNINKIMGIEDKIILKYNNIAVAGNITFVYTNLIFEPAVHLWQAISFLKRVKDLGRVVSTSIVLIGDYNEMVAIYDTEDVMDMIDNYKEGVEKDPNIKNIKYKTYMQITNDYFNHGAELKEDIQDRL